MGGLLKEIVDKSLPTISSRYLASATLLLAGFGFWLPEFLRKIGHPIAVTNTLSFRIAVMSTILFLGTFIILILVLRAYKNLSSEHAAEIELQKKRNQGMNISEEAISRFGPRSQR